MEDSDVDEFSDVEEDFEDEEGSSSQNLDNADKPEANAAPVAEKTTADEDDTQKEETITKLLEMETKSMRQFMPALRKAVDPRLFVYSRTNEHEQYSRLCAAVDNRQPMILTPTNGHILSVLILMLLIHLRTFI